MCSRGHRVGEPFGETLSLKKNQDRECQQNEREQRERELIGMLFNPVHKLFGGDLREIDHVENETYIHFFRPENVF